METTTTSTQETTALCEAIISLGETTTGLSQVISVEDTILNRKN